MFFSDLLPVFGETLVHQLCQKYINFPKWIHLKSYIATNTLFTIYTDYHFKIVSNLLKVLARWPVLLTWILLTFTWSFFCNKLLKTNYFLMHQELYLRNNELDNLPPDVFSNMPKLSQLGLSGNRLKTVDGNIFSHMPGWMTSHVFCVKVNSLIFFTVSPQIWRSCTFMTTHGSATVRSSLWSDGWDKLRPSCHPGMP